YQHSGNLDDLEASVKHCQAALDLTGKEDSDRAGRLQNLALALRERYLRHGDVKDLDTSLEMGAEAVALTPSGNSARAVQLHSHGVSLGIQYKRTGDLKYLEAALQIFREAVDLTPPEHPDRSPRLQDLGVSLEDRSHRLGDLEDLEAALQLFQEARDLTPPGHPNRPQRLQNLAASLRHRYERLGDLKDLEAAIHTDQEAVELIPFGHPELARQLGSLAVSLENRYQRLGDLKDLEAVLHLFQKAIDLTPPGHPDRPNGLHDLALSLGDRYRRLGDLTDLEAALRIMVEAVILTPSGHYHQLRQLQNLGGLLAQRYQRLGDLKDLKAALEIREEAVKLTPLGHPDRAGRLEDLGVSLTHRYQRLGESKDLEAALQSLQDAVDLTPPGHPYLGRLLNDLSTVLTDQYLRFGDLKDLEAALQKTGQAVELTPSGHPDQTGLLQNLGVSLTHRYRRLGELKDLEAIHTHYTQSFKIPSSTPENSWKQALNWAAFAAEFQPSDCIPAFQAAFALLPEMLWLGHSIVVRQSAIYRLDISGATSTAIQTCIDLAQLQTAIEILEQGLSTIFQQMLQLKTDVDVLPPHQAKKLIELSSQLYSGTFTDPITIAEDRNKLLKDIRRQPGFEYFLLPKSYNVLRHACQGGPVVILNSHKDHCDAIILLKPTSQPVHVPLPIVTVALLKSQHGMLKELLGCCGVRYQGQSWFSRLFGRRLLLSISQLIFSNPQHNIANGRLWWLPIGEFTGLPWHASAPTDVFIHSYTPTLGSLLDAYAKKPTNTAPKLAVIAVTHTDSHKSNLLKGVREEVNKISSIVKAPQIQCLVGEQATVDAVKVQLQGFSWVHLACHGRQDQVDPTKSHLQLYGGKLELERILRMPLSNAQFVFLAACQTAMGDAGLVNESFHLSGGFIAAGFRSVVGTMWSMNDADGPTVAEILYAHLFREGQQPQASDAAEALQLAVNELKRQKVPYERWLPFIHTG
ncbi:CHAT domain-containing protein, partial [Mycena galericulata]